MNKHITSFFLCLVGLAFTSCGPYVATPYQQPPTTPSATAPSLPSTPKVDARQTVSSPAQKEIRRQQDNPPYSSTTPTISAPKPPVARNHPTAAPIPDRPGWVYNPYNNNPVFVQGIASGKTVRDPKDPNVEHKFRVP